MIMPWPPSPPRTFCQEYVMTSSFFQSPMSMPKTAEVASQIVRPSRLSEIQLVLGTLTPEVVPL